MRMKNGLKIKIVVSVSATGKQFMRSSRQRGLCDVAVWFSFSCNCTSAKVETHILSFLLLHFLLHHVLQFNIRRVQLMWLSHLWRQRVSLSALNDSLLTLGIVTTEIILILIFISNNIHLFQPKMMPSYKAWIFKAPCLQTNGKR